MSMELLTEDRVVVVRNFVTDETATECKKQLESFSASADAPRSFLLVGQSAQRGKFHIKNVI